jgi:6-phosphogluconolactonase (cycloisomerase 2 family)
VSKISRRTFLSLTASTVAVSAFASKQLESGKVAYYVANGSEVIHYDVDVAKAVLTKRNSIMVPTPVQYAWPHANRRSIYLACSDQAKQHYLATLSIDQQTGELSKLGEWTTLPDRPIHISTDIPSEFVLVAFNAPSNVRVFRVNKDLTVGSEVPQPGITDKGNFCHQIRVTPDNKHAIMVTRGVSAAGNKPEDPGALKIFDYSQGVLSNEASVAPNGGFGFGPRHLDFHPTKPWVYVSLERESKLFVYKLNNGRIDGDAVFQKDTVSDPAILKNPRQLGGAIHMHPNGRFVYVANRNDGTTDFNGKKVLIPGENTVVVYSINQTTGEPTAIQFADTRKVNPRTFALDPDAKFMTVQHIIPMNVRDGENVKVEPAGVTTFRVGADGKLTYVDNYDLEVKGADQVLWGNMVRL